MASARTSVHRLKEEKERLFNEMEAIRHKIAGIDLALRFLEGDDDAPSPPIKRAPRGGVKNVVLDALTFAGEIGLTVAECLSWGEAKGTPLDRGTVSSLLSRLKRDGVLTYDGQRYRTSNVGDLLEKGRP